MGINEGHAVDRNKLEMSELQLTWLTRITTP